MNDEDHHADGRDPAIPPSEEFVRFTPRLGADAFQLSGFLDDDFGDFPLPSVPELVAWLVSGRLRYDAGIHPKVGQFPSLLLTHQPGHGISALLLREEGDLFLLAGREIGPPTVRVEIPPNVVETWPEALFSPEPRVVKAVEHVLAHGGPHPGLDWVRNGDFPRGAVRPNRRARPG